MVIFILAEASGPGSGVTVVLGVGVGVSAALSLVLLLLVELIASAVIGSIITTAIKIINGSLDTGFLAALALAALLGVGVYFSSGLDDLGVMGLELAAAKVRTHGNDWASR